MPYVWRRFSMMPFLDFLESEGVNREERPYGVRGLVMLGMRVGLRRVVAALNHNFLYELYFW